MNRTEIIEKINTFLADEFEVDKILITPDANLKETLQLDSLDYVDLVVVIETNFKFKVQPTDFQGIVTFEDFYNYVINRMEEK